MSAPLKTSARVRQKITALTAPKEGKTYFINRNPRNLERLRIAYKPSGYHLEKPGRSFWHKLVINVTGRYVSAEVQHFENGTVLSASTSEWAIKKQLYQTKDTAAFVNLGRVFAQRCLKSGIIEMRSDVEAKPGTKIEKFLKTVEESGVVLSEPERYMPEYPWNEKRPEKPWKVFE